MIIVRKFTACILVGIISCVAQWRLKITIIWKALRDPSAIECKTNKVQGKGSQRAKQYEWREMDRTRFGLDPSSVRNVVWTISFHRCYMTCWVPPALCSRFQHLNVLTSSEKYKRFSLDYTWKAVVAEANDRLRSQRRGWKHYSNRPWPFQKQGGPGATHSTETNIAKKNGHQLCTKQL